MWDSKLFHGDGAGRYKCSCFILVLVIPLCHMAPHTYEWTWHFISINLEILEIPLRGLVIY